MVLVAICQQMDTLIKRTAPKAVALEIGRKGLRVVNLDITVVAEKPLLGPHREAMRRNLAAALDCAEAAVSVKASRSGGLGPVGRGEGIAAWCVALLDGRR